MRQVRALFVRLLGATALVAVGSYWWQLPGLASSRGIAPLAGTMAAVRAEGLSFLDLPTLLWLSDGDLALHLLCLGGLVAGALLLGGLVPGPACALLYVTWLSLCGPGQPFLSFQWDMLLVEVAFYACFFVPWRVWRLGGADEPEPHPAARWALAVVACKVTLGSGLVKLLSGDSAWRDCSALTYHWWSQPLPTFSSVWLSWLPLSLQELLCQGMFVLELPTPLLALGPRPLRLASALGLLLLQAALFAAGNYSYFNLLCAALAVPLLDDEVLRWAFPRWAGPAVAPSVRPRWLLAAGWVGAGLVGVLSAAAFVRGAAPGPVEAVRRVLSPWHVVNAYGAFAVMTRNRAEILVEGSADGREWRPYEFRWKPGALDRRPDFVAPWQPRLDWQMWFASLSRCGADDWFLSFQRHLLLGTPEVLALLGPDPFAGAPPRYLRTMAWEYRFARGGTDWWVRSEPRPYCPPVTLGPDGRLRVADL